MKKYVGVAAILCGVVLMATPATALTLQDLINTGTLQVQDKIFSDFAYTPVNPVNDSAASVNVAVVFNQLPGAEDQHGFIFSHASGPLGTVWGDGFTLSYKIAVAPEFPTVKIIESLDQMNDGSIGAPYTVQVSDNQPGVGILVMNNQALGLSDDIKYPSGLTSITTTSTATFTGADARLVSYEQDWFETGVPTVPEPTSMLLLGSGLIGLAVCGRKKFSKK